MQWRNVSNVCWSFKCRRPKVIVCKRYRANDSLLCVSKPASHLRVSRVVLANYLDEFEQLITLRYCLLIQKLAAIEY